MTLLEIDSRDIELSNLDKLLFAGAGITKGELIDYYRDVARVLVPRARDRPLTLQRFPDGVDEQGFIQQRRPAHFPDWIEDVTVPRADGRGSVTHVVCNDGATLVYLANQGVIALHGWLSRKDMSSQRYTLANLRRRLGQKADPWSAIDRHAANLANARAALARLGKEHGGQRSTGPET